jgi:hypothetical protein
MMKIKFKNAMHRSTRGAFVAAVVATGVVATSCGSNGSHSSSGQASQLQSTLAQSVTPQTLKLDVSAVDTTFVTRDHFVASVEMQISGEPFAQAMGRDLGGFSRDYVCQSCPCQASVYYDPALGGTRASRPRSNRTSTRSSR